MHFAKVIAGHDKNHIYFILKEDEKYVYLVNGNNKKICNPRKKIKKHIQIIRNMPKTITDVLENDREITDEIVSKMVYAYLEILESKVNS